ncbi:unnamed protein product [Closterium sp. Yama58-4]|nr:unnamed protein product [Closterium sp. Yama58-4]
MWFAETPSKRWAEKFFLYYSPVWITWALGIIVPFQLYKRFTEWEYLWVGLAAALPCVLVPPAILCAADKGRPWQEQHWVKANVWIAIFSFVGNYFWTHYFYTLLGASYTFPSWRLNDVPFALYLLTHAYFCFYHTATIANFEYYTFVDKAAMYRVGTLFYALYFVVSFPFFFRIDEDPSDSWPLSRVAVDSLGASMLVTILLDIWRLVIGPITQLPQTNTCSSGLPWMG